MKIKIPKLVGSFFKWPASLISTRVRLSIGLSVAVLSLVLLAQLFELIPNPNTPAMESRALQAETLALSGTAIYESTRSIRSFEKTLENTVKRSEKLLSIGLRNDAGRLVINIGGHHQRWQEPKNHKSNDQFIFVPVLDGDRKIGQLELCYEPLITFSSWFKSDIAILALFLVSGSFLMFNLILHRTLKQLDPRGAVPRRVREALDNLAEGLLIIDRHNRIMLANSTFGTLVGVDPDLLSGQNVNHFPWETDEKPWELAVAEQRPISDGCVKTVDVHGVMRTFNVSASPVMGHKGSCRGVMVTFDDITTLEEHKRDLIDARQEADRANEAKSIFLSRMSHEIRTPMNAIIGYTDVLRQGGSSKKEEQKYLTTIHSSGEHLMELINDILDLSKIESGKMTMEFRQCRLVPLLSVVTETMRMRAEQKGLTLDLKVHGRVPATIRTDETRLRQILINNIGNAIKFTHKGAVRLSVCTTDDGMIRMDVTDTGVGIPEHAIETIFQPFSQADNSVTRKYGGTGLGLTISKQLAEALGGGISVHSQVGVGTVFSIVIDPGSLDDVQWVTGDELESQSTLPLSEVIANRRFRNGHVLVVDDGEENRDLASLMLGRAGLTCDMAVNGQRAIEMVSNRKYDVVLMDMNMPVMDGMTATKILRSKGCTTPIIALTALANVDDRKKCLDGGCDGFLAKPIRIESLTDVLAKYLSLVDSTSVIASAKPEPTSKPARPVQPATTLMHEDDIESGLAQTLASLGLEISHAKSGAKVSGKNSGELVLPEVVVSSLTGDSDMQPIVSSFVTRLSSRMGEFDEAWSAGEMSRLKDLGHWLAGAAATVGFENFVAPAREIEYSDGSNPKRIVELINHLHQLEQRIDLGVTQAAGAPVR